MLAVALPWAGARPVATTVLIATVLWARLAGGVGGSG